MRDRFVSMLPDWWVKLPAFVRLSAVLAVLAIVCLLASAWVLAILLGVVTVFVFVIGSMRHR